MAPRVIRDEDRLTVVTRSTWIAGLGFVAFAGLGVPLFVGGLGGDGTAAAIVRSILGGLLFVVALAVLTLAHVTMIDKSTGRYRSGWMTLGWWHAREGPLASLQGVIVTSRSGRGIVGLVGMTAERVVNVFVTQSVDEAVAREVAAEVAAFTGLRLFDEANTRTGEDELSDAGEDRGVGSKSNPRSGVE